MAGSRLIAAFAVLHCDKVSWFGHIEAPTVRFLVQALIVSGDNGLKRSGGFLGIRYCVAARLVPAKWGLPDGCWWIGQNGHWLGQRCLRRRSRLAPARVRSRIYR